MLYIRQEIERERERERGRERERESYHVVAGPHLRDVQEAGYVM